MSAVQEIRDALPFVVCKACGCVEFDLNRLRLRLHGHDGDVVINRLECHYCGEAVTLLP